MQAIATTTDLVKNNTFSDSANNHKANKGWHRLKVFFITSCHLLIGP